MCKEINDDLMKMKVEIMQPKIQAQLYALELRLTLLEEIKEAQDEDLELQKIESDAKKGKITGICDPRWWRVEISR